MPDLRAKAPSATFRYDLSDEDITALTETLIASKPFATDDRVVCYRVSGRSQFSDIGRHLERRVFEETFPGNDAAFMAREYGPYEEASIFFLSVDRAKQRTIGVLRAIRSSPAGLKTLNDLAQPESPVNLAADQVVTHHNIVHPLDWLLPLPTSFRARVRVRTLRCPKSGAKGIRTPDLLDANETRYQLRHSP
jgi:hypothetical protein